MHTSTHELVSPFVSVLPPQLLLPFQRNIFFFLWKGLRRHNIQNKEVTSLVFDIQSGDTWLGYCLVVCCHMMYYFLFVWNRTSEKNNTTHHLILMFVCFSFCFVFFFFSYQKPGEKKMIFCTIAQGKNA